MTVAPRAAMLALLSSLCASCISVNYTRTQIGAPVSEELTATLRPDQATFDEVLLALGSPTIVWPSENGDVVMAYAWLDQAGWGVSLSYSLERFASARLKWDSEHSEIPAVVFQFDRELHLRSFRRGLLRDIAPYAVERESEFSGFRNALR